MKNLVAILLLLIIVAGVWHDLSKGSLPHHSSKATTTTVSSSNIPYEVVEITGGDTVLSILEELHNGSLPIGIEQAIADFSELNDGVSPEKVQIGTSYKFPIYNISAQ